ncbi:Holliday junction branch migration protein RuvA [Minwuia thermotolerans]|uniref:Holliday junction branch migration complex subunit RuvA n=1 Tax=Minwuia thermotolerans TaxID=2056226 RepID=A0A2M9G4R6_9PROT|nr:Holliday junction branch migration protein RuvA [Minwuia thermotolerans]PJK29350.1 Holliday junction branch migration protein RuvA [Minwuia thermotolerans]PJK30465.1 Holliday junction branch migration protein RuvA [Minwuia thermotolerans]PJK30688.1 Holliday junction branch migration protein RuvA [Minwuia thermotolerans]
MIASLKGILDRIGADHAVIDVGGVGYLVFCSARTLAALGTEGDAVAIQVETHVREDHIHLYGFADRAEKELFGLLQTVQGVGAKVTLQILSALAADDIRMAIASGDVATITRAPGVGKRLAQRIASELKDKVGALPARPAQAGAAPGAAPVGGAAGDAASALVNLGYRRAEAEAAVLRGAAIAGEDATVEALITAGLKELAR